MIRSDYLFDVDIDYDREKLLSEAKSYSPSLWNYYFFDNLKENVEEVNGHFQPFSKRLNYNDVSNINPEEIYFKNIYVNKSETNEEVNKVILQLEDMFCITENDYEILFLEFFRPLNWIHYDANTALCIFLGDFSPICFYEKNEKNDYFYKCALLNGSKKKHRGISLDNRLYLRIPIKSKTYEECKKKYFSN